MNEDNATNIDNIKINSIEWYIPHYTPSIPQQATLSKQILGKPPTKLKYVERSVLLKEINAQFLWFFDSRTQERINISIWIVESFQQRGRQYNQNLNNDSFFRPPITSVQCIAGTEKYPDSSILTIYNDAEYIHGFG